MTLGQRISMYRKDLGISQEALGERLGVSRQAVSKWETDAASPDMANLIALAREFGVSVAELTQTPEPRDVPVTDVPAGSPSRRGWWAALGALVVVILVMIGVVIYWCVHANDGQISKTPEPPDATASDTENTLPAPSSDFALILDWTETGEFLELGEQQGAYPFGTSLWLDSEETTVTADDGSTVYTID
ncbi:helix-turn-helix domain-containing protein, partial [Dysosmobacter sp.]|uniref:helix-turn-helix domain-containing protein n=1 Tax=Dysosmobacter sp. TaxID=2591382 RepID=UPI002A884812